MRPGRDADVSGNSIYTTRSTVAAYYTYRIESLSSQLKEQQTERAKTIKKLKEATKYDSTHELLEKYGGAEGMQPRPRKDSADDYDDEEEDDTRDRRPHHGMDGQSNVGARRTNLPPPPTANIQRQPHSAAPGPPLPGSDIIPPHSPMSPHPQSAVSSTSIPVTEEFAPNAFAHTPPPPPQAQVRYDAAAGPHWYDRVMDLLLGEDETAAKNRIVLICQRCRLVNGQAPPGTNSLSELGLWKCMSCGSKNGEMDEGEKIVQEVLGARRKNGSQQSGREPQASNTEGEFEKEEGGYQDEVESGVVGGRSEREDGKATAGARKRKGKK